MQNSTIQTIDSTVRRINTHPEYSCLVNRRFTNYLRSEANKHAYAMEHNSQKNDEGLKFGKIKEHALENIEDARDFLNREGLTVSSLSRMGKIIEPQNHPYGSFRPGEVKFLGYNAPEPGTLHQEIDNLIWVLEGNVNVSPVLRAAEAHLDFLRIHPYSDGNSRAAILIQNYFLESSNYPPAVIPSEEKELYLRILSGALNDRYNKISSFQDPGYADKIFYEYIAKNLLTSVASLEKELIDNRNYRLFLSNIRGPGMAYTIQRALRSTFGRHSKLFQVEFAKGSGPKSKEPKIDITGNIGRECVEKAVAKIKEKHNSGIKYQIKTLTDCR